MILLALTLACSVTDGDTIRCGDERVRLLGIDTPELFSPRCPREKQQARAAKDRLAELLRAGTMTLDRDGADRFGRTLATVRVDGVDVGAVLVREGHAREWTGRRETWC